MKRSELEKYLGKNRERERAAVAAIKLIAEIRCIMYLKWGQ